MDIPIQTADQQLEILLGMMPSSWRIQFAWSSLDNEFQEFLTVPNCGDQAIFIKARALFDNLEDPSKKDEIIRAQVSNISSEFTNACVRIIEDSELKMPARTLFTIARRRSHQFTTRDISDILKEDEISVTNISTTMESLVRKRFIREVKTKEGQEQIYELTQVGLIEIKRLLKM